VAEHVPGDRETAFSIGLRMARESRGLSLSAAARLAGITKAHLHDMEAARSRNPCVSTLAGLAKAYCIPLGWFAERAAESLADAARSAPQPSGNAIPRAEP
jgi:transcriptional regulator with XRE-family HTH domain